MHEIPSKNKFDITKILLLAGAFVFLYWSVLEKLGRDWWSDENYSHGLLVPFVIGLLIWRDWDGLKASARSGALWVGGGLCVLAMLMLVAGLLGAELFTTRVSMVFMLAGTVVYLFGGRILRLLAVPLALLVLAIPIPQIIFNKISFPLQIWASKTAVWGIRLFGVPTVRKGNVFDILPAGSTQVISLEVVGACSGIRSLMTLATLALVLGYFTSNSRGAAFVNFRSPDLWRTVCLMGLAVPIAVLTNAARVTGTGVLTYHFGKQATDGIWHELSGWLVYLVSLAILFGANYLLRRVFKQEPPDDDLPGIAEPLHNRNLFLPIIAFMILGGIAVTWIVNRGEADIQRKPLTELPSVLGNW
jgi:exosortase